MFKKDLRIFGNYTWQWFSTATFRRNNKSSDMQKTQSSNRVLKISLVLKLSGKK